MLVGVNCIADYVAPNDSILLDNSALGFIRREIGQRVRLRFTPEISFALDTSLDYGDHIQKLLLQVEGERTNVDNAQGRGDETPRGE